MIKPLFPFWVGFLEPWYQLKLTILLRSRWVYADYGKSKYIFKFDVLTHVHIDDTTRSWLSVAQIGNDFRLDGTIQEHSQWWGCLKSCFHPCNCNASPFSWLTLVQPPTLSIAPGSLLRWVRDHSDGWFQSTITNHSCFGSETIDERGTALCNVGPTS